MIDMMIDMKIFMYHTPHNNNKKSRVYMMERGCCSIYYSPANIILFVACMGRIVVA